MNLIMMLEKKEQLIFYGRDDNNEEKYTRLISIWQNSFIFAEDAFDINFAKK